MEVYRPHMVRSYVTAMRYPTLVRVPWLVAALAVIPACSAAAPSTTAPSPTAPGPAATSPATTVVATTAPIATAPATSAVPAGVVLPNPQLTPGETDPRVTQANIGRTICVSGYTTTVRPPESVTEAIKVRAMAAYGLHDSLANYELDHLIPLEVGGAPSDIRNLWPEPYERHGAGRAAPGTGSETKDRVENAANRAVCSGRMTLAVAQQRIAGNWYALGQALGAI